MNILLKIAYVLSWIPAACIKLAMMIFGLFAVPFSLVKEGKHRTPAMWWMWGNDEEGPEPEWWMQQSQHENIIATVFPRYWWLAIRNPANNSRFIFKDRAFPTVVTNAESGMEAHNLIANGRTSAYRWAYSGPFAGYRRVWLTKPDKYSEIWFGWKIGSSVPGMGFTMQIRRNREIGT